MQNARGVGLAEASKKLLPVFPADHRTASMSKSHQLSADGAATKGEQRQDHPAGGTLVRVIRMAPPGGREPGFSKERRLEPQITIGLLTGQDGSR